MGILSRIFGKIETRAVNSDSYGRAFGIAQTSSGRHVSPYLAENLATVLACVNAISRALASMPPLVYRHAETGRIELRDHPVARLVRAPSNGRLSWPDLIEWMMAQALLHGNAVMEIQYDGAGRPTALVPLPWPLVHVVLLPSGRLAYDIQPAAGPRRRLLEGEVFHLRDRTDDGIVGRSRLSRAPEVLGNALSLQDWSGALWHNGATPSGAISFPHSLTHDQGKALRESLNQNVAGTQNARRVMVLENGAQWQSISISPEDAEVLGSRRWAAEDLARLFDVPPPIVGDLSHGTFTNSREAGRWFSQFTLAPWARKIEAEFQRSVFGASSNDCTLEIDMSSLQRGDPEARWQSHKIAVEAGILDPNEIREIEGWNARSAGGE